jgi:hypothetical protein
MRRDPTSHITTLIEALHPDGAVDEPGGEDPPVSPGPGLVIGGRLPRSLAEDAIAWVTVPPGRRGRMRAELRRQGLLVVGSWLPIPRSSPRVLLPLAPVSTAVRRRLAEALPGGLLMRITSWFPTRVLEELAPGVGLLAQLPGARPALAWLDDLGIDKPVVLLSSWHEPDERLVLVGEHSVVKTSRAGSEHDPRREASTLQDLGPGARRAGARVPGILFTGAASRRTALVEDALAGSRAAEHLRRHPSRLDDVVAKVADWLAHWHIETRAPRLFTPDDLERLVLAPARALAPHIPDGAGYVERLEGLGRSLCGTYVPFAAAHNDLTTWNLLVGCDALAVLDWEAAEREALPLVDIEYFVVDAVSAARRTSRAAAFQLCGEHGRYTRLGRSLRDDLRSRLGLEPAVAELARHACWIHHARNEHGRAAGAERPFLEIVARLAQA